MSRIVRAFNSPRGEGKMARTVQSFVRTYRPLPSVASYQRLRCWSPWWDASRPATTKTTGSATWKSAPARPAPILRIVPATAGPGRYRLVPIRADTLMMDNVTRVLTALSGPQTDCADPDDNPNIVGCGTRPKRRMEGRPPNVHTNHCLLRAGVQRGKRGRQGPSSSGRVLRPDVLADGGNWRPVSDRTVPSPRRSSGVMAYPAALGPR
jgi:hypothetical protein